MILLPDRYAYCSPPIAMVGPHLREVIPSEEFASLWVWVRPRLLGWPRPINWLPPQVVDARWKTSGDLWGLDSVGNLIIVETKLDSGASSKDPFGSLVPYLKRRARDHTWSAKELWVKWLEGLASEKKVIENEIATFWSTGRITGIYPGVPYLLDRYAVWRFRSLYCTIVERALLNRRYERAVERALRLREAAGDPPPVFAGLIATARNNFQLSSEGRKNLLALQKYADPSRIVLRAINATRGLKVLRINCWSPVTRLKFDS